MTERRIANNDRLTQVLHFFCRYNQDQFYVLCLLQLSVFQGLELLQSAFYKFEDNFSFFVILFRNTINCKFLQVSLFHCASAVIFCWRSFLSDFDDLVLLSILSANFCKSNLISLLMFWSVLLLPCNEFFNSLNLLSKYSFSYFTS